MAMTMMMMMMFGGCLHGLDERKERWHEFLALPSPLGRRGLGYPGQFLPNTARMFDQYQRILWQMPDISLHSNIVCRQTFLKCSTSPKLASFGCVHHDLCSTTSSRR